MNSTRYRVILAVLGIVFIVIVIGAVLFTPSGDPGAVPDPVDSIAPADGDLVLRQTTVVLDLQSGYEARLTIDGTPIPPTEVAFIEGTGRHEFAPGPGKTIEEWTVGFHVVEATWDRANGLPDPGSLTWSFRVQ
jgi:hypothetical protein